MADLLAVLDPQPSGFGNCGTCAYRDTGHVQICFACARQGMMPLAEHRCQVCDQTLAAASAPCGNPVCAWRDDRRFEWNRAVALRHGMLSNAISRYKYQGRTGWATIFGRVLAGYLDQNVGLFSGFDLIISSPTYVGSEPGGRPFDHTAKVLAEAARLHERGLPFVVDTQVITKVAATKKLVDCANWTERFQVCETQVRPALRVPDRHVVDGKKILVYDDVFTDGLNLNVVAGVLRQHGAQLVCGVSLARQPWS